MQTHSRSCFAGPISGRREWWRQIDANDTPASNNKEPMFRAALVEQIRKEIAAGTYDTDEKWDIALDRLMKRMEAEDA